MSEAIREKTKAAVQTLGELIGCFPAGSEQAKNLESARGIVLDAVLGLELGKESDGLSKQAINLAGEYAHLRIDRAMERQDMDDRIAALFGDRAMLRAIVERK